MDQQPTYEQLIAHKLVNRPVPDMADAIWSRIEAQLDIDMPTDDIGDPPPSAPSGPGVIGWGLGIVVLALLSILFIPNNKQKTQTSTTNVPSPVQQILKPSETTIGPPKGFGAGDRNSPFKNVTAAPVQQSSLDSLLPQLVPELLTRPADSIKIGPPEPLVQSPSIDTALVKKKRGVSGLNDSDYRIVPKKDSTQ